MDGGRTTKVYASEPTTTSVHLVPLHPTPVWVRTGIWPPFRQDHGTAPDGRFPPRKDADGPKRGTPGLVPRDVLDPTECHRWALGAEVEPEEPSHRPKTTLLPDRVPPAEIRFKTDPDVGRLLTPVSEDLPYSILLWAHEVSIRILYRSVL